MSERIYLAPLNSKMLIPPSLIEGGGGGGLSKSEVEALIAIVGVIAPEGSTDETGATDTTALAAAMPAQGTLMLQNGPYYVTHLPTCGPGQAIRSTRETVVYVVGKGTGFRIYNPAFPVEGGQAVYANNMGPKSGGFIIDGSKAEAGATGIQLGDFYALDLEDTIVRNFSGAGSTGWLFKSEVGWLERTHIRNCHSVNNTTHIHYTLGGTALSSIMFSDIDIAILAVSKQTGIVIDKGIQIRNSIQRHYGNFYGGAGNTAAVLEIGEDGSSVAITGTLYWAFEADGAATHHKTIMMGASASVRMSGGHIIFTEAAQQGGNEWSVGNVKQPNANFTGAGYIQIDENLGVNHIGEGLNVLGGSTWSQGFHTVAAGNVEIGVNAGDYFAATLASGVNVLKLNNSSQSRARHIWFAVTQPAAGEPGTISLTGPGNNLNGNAQTVSMGSGPALALQTAHGAVDILELTTLDGQHWYIRVLSPRASVDSFLGIARPVYAASLLPSTESVIGEANKSIFARCVIPVTGVLHDITVFNGSVVNGNHNVGILDTGQATAGSYTSLWESGSVAAAGENAAQVVGSPELAVTAGEQLMFGVMNSGTTHKFGEVPTASHAGWTKLPASFIPTSGGALPKTLATHKYGSLAFGTITEVEMESLGTPPLVIVGRIV